MAHPYSSVLHPMVNEMSNNGGDEDQQQGQQQRQKLLLQQNYLQPTQQIDVRMKRHPEIQPYVPSDRDRLLVGSKGPINCSTGGGSSISGKMNAQPRPIINQRNTITNTKDAKSLPTRPKKCVSMTRLDQLAQPKRDFTRKPQLNSKPKTNSRPVQPPPPLSPRSQEVMRAKLTKSKRNAVSGIDNRVENEKKKLELTLASSNEVKLQSPQEKQVSKLEPSISESPKAVPPNSESTKRQSESPNSKPSTLHSPKSEQECLSTKKSQSIQDNHSIITTTTSCETPTSTPTNKILDQTFDTGRKRFPSSYNVQGSLWDELNGGSLNHPVNNLHKQNNESSLVEQMSDLSTTDRHYLSATSELVQDSESSTNGISFNKDFGSLYKDLEAGLIAEGIVSKVKLPESILEEQHESPVLLPVDKELLKPQDEEKRLKAEEELKELAKREEQERQTRQSLVDSILSRVNQST